MELLKRISLLFSLVFVLSGCTMTGNYMKSHQLRHSYNVDGQQVYARFVQLTPTWIMHQNPYPEYRVGPYDILSVVVWNHPELTTTSTISGLPGATQSGTSNQTGILVGSHGNITFPFAGTFNVAGLTILQIQALIAKRISAYIRNPQVTARVITFRSKEIQVLGEVGIQKTIPLSDKPLSLFDALNGAGGTEVMSANTARIYVIRGNVSHLTVYCLNAKSAQNMMVAQRFIMRNNDIVYVPALGVTNWSRVIGQVLPIFNQAITTKSDVAAVSN